uniref:Pseudouridine synthase n=1 Tax=Sphingobacterium sp. (strain 21) TaxID=743722 RepID=F4C7V0_SPHS2
MPFSNKRNSRDDKSAYSRRSSSRNDTGNSRDDKSPYVKRSSSRDEDRNQRSDKPYSTRSFSQSDNNKEFRDKEEKSAFSKKSNYGSQKHKRDDRSSSTNQTNKTDRYNKQERSYSGTRRNTRDERPYSSDRKNQNTRFKSDNNFAEGSRYRSDEKMGNRSYGNTKRDKFKSNEQRFSKEREENGLIRLNRYIANSGVCSRRKADELIQAGVVTVNGVVVTELGTKVDAAKDEIRYNGEKLKREKMVYVLLNKPKDYITTTDDPQERKTVMHLVEKASRERIYPVGRLDRNTTGLLLLTNDGNLAEKLSHPRNNIMKIYHVELNKSLTQGDFNKIGYGVELEDGFIKPDEVSYIQGASKREIGIQIHSGRNRIVRRIFESLGYDVIKLDRVIYANLTKKDLPRGRWRYLEEKEIIQLKHFIK